MLSCSKICIHIFINILVRVAFLKSISKHGSYIRWQLTTRAHVRKSLLFLTFQIWSSCRFKRLPLTHRITLSTPCMHNIFCATVCTSNMTLKLLGRTMMNWARTKVSCTRTSGSWGTTSPSDMLSGKWSRKSCFGVWNIGPYTYTPKMTIVQL